MAFDLGAALKNVSKLDTGKEQIIYLPIGSLDSDPKNFYELRGIEELADNISVAGLQQPIRVRAGEVPGRYTIVSGHRRLAAVKTLAEEDPEKWADVPCIIETDDASPALQQLRLIYANANTRQLTSAEQSDQAAQVERLLYQLKEEGYEFPGRMRDHVAQAVGASRTKLARLKVIREHLIPEAAESWRAEKISESTAYLLAQADPERQKLIFEAKGKDKNGMLLWLPEHAVKNSLSEMDKAWEACEKLTCFRGCPCSHAAAREQRAAKLESYSALTCHGCCRECIKLATCKGSCEYAGDAKMQKVAKEKAEKAEVKAAEQERKEKADAKNQQAIDLAAVIFRRAEGLRAELGIPTKELVAIWTPCSVDYYANAFETFAAGETPGSYTTLPGGITPKNAMALVATAEKLGCSVDYLLGREDSAPAAGGGGWKKGTPPKSGNYAVAFRYRWDKSKTIDEFYWNGHGWIMYKMPVPEDGIVEWWMELPEEDHENG